MIILCIESFSELQIYEKILVRVIDYIHIKNTKWYKSFCRHRKTTVLTDIATEPTWTWAGSYTICYFIY